MEKLLAIVGTILIFGCLSVVLKRYLTEYAFLLNILVGFGVLTTVVIWAMPIFQELKLLVDISKIPKEYGIILVKCFGICMLTQFSSDSCVDCGEISLSKKVEIIGKVSMLTTALPMFQKVVSIAVNLF